MTILIVHQFYLLAGEPGGSRFNELAKQWASAGHRVTVVAGNRNYATGRVPDELRSQWAVETRDGAVTVWRCHVPASYNAGFLGRVWAFAGFTISSLYASIRAENPDVIITTSPPLTVAITGWALRRFRFPKAKWVFEVRDLWPESAVTTGVLSGKSLLTRLLYRLEAAAYRNCDLISVLTPAFKADIVRRQLADDNKIATIPNAADFRLFEARHDRHALRESLGWSEKFVLLYAGAHGTANAITQLVDAAERLKHRKDILIASVGDGPKRRACEESAGARGLTNIVFLGPVAKDRVHELIVAADVGVAVLQNNATFKTVYPNKIFDYMACSRATLLAIDGAARDLVCQQAQAGVFATPENPADLAVKIRWMADNRDECLAMGKRGHDWAKVNASRDSIGASYLTVLSNLTKCSTQRDSSAVSTC